MVNEKEMGHRVAIARRAAEVVRLVANEGMVHLLIASKVGELVAEADALLGEGMVNDLIAQARKTAGDRAAGICILCHSQPAMASDELCSGCDKEMEDALNLGLLEFLDPKGSKH